MPDDNVVLHQVLPLAPSEAFRRLQFREFQQEWLCQLGMCR